MDFSESVENKLKLILNKLMQMNAVRSFKLTIKWGKKDDLVKIDLLALNILLDECLDKITLKPRRAEIRNVISELVKKKNYANLSSEISENKDVLTETDTIFNSNDCDLGFGNDAANADHLNMRNSGVFERFNFALGNRNIGNFFNEIDHSEAISTNEKIVSESHDLTEKVSEQYLCEYCGEQFFQSSAWKNHFFITHKQGNESECEKEGSTVSDGPRLKCHVKEHEKEKLQCGICSKSFSSQSILESHALTHEGPLEKCESGFRESKLIVRSIRGENKFEASPAEFKCNYCFETFESKRARRTHLNLKHKELTRRKKSCACHGLKFKSKEGLQNHVNSECKILANNKFFCHYKNCDKVFKKRAYLRKHIRLNHLPQKNVLSCHFCPKTFFEKTKLNRHVDCHQEEKFQCDLCAKSFTRGDVLKRHRLLVHEKKKKFQCKFCQKMFSLKYNRDCHEKNVHVEENDRSTELDCEICGKRLRNISTFRIHVKIHRPERNFSCCLCGKKFIRQIHYRTHMKSQHLGISPFQNLLDSFAAEGECD